VARQVTRLREGEALRRLQGGERSLLQRDERDAFLREDGHPELIPGRRAKAVAA